MNFKHKHIFLLPGLLTLAGILIFPIIFTVRLSLSSWDSFYPGLDFIGIENYIRLFTDDSRFWESFARLSFLSVTTVFLQYVIGFSLALMVWQDIKFQRFFRVLFLIPMMSTPVIMTVIWRTVFHESLGPVNDFFSLFDMAPPWLSNEYLSLLTVITVEVWQWTPFMVLIMLAGLRSLPKEPFEAAAIDGASPLQAFFKLTLPMMSKVIAIAVLIRGIDLLRTFDYVKVMTDSGPGTATETLTSYAGRIYFGSADFPYASTIALFTLIVVIIASSAFMSIFKVKL